MNKYKFSKKESQTGYFDASGLYFQSIYLADYKKYCEPKFKIPIKYWYQEALGISELVHRLNKHIFRLSDSNEPVCTRLEQFISIPSSAIKIIKTSIINIPNFINAINKDDY